MVSAQLELGSRERGSIIRDIRKLHPTIARELADEYGYDNG